jgi:hypothetical protein
LNTFFWLVGAIGVVSILSFGYMFFRGKAEYERILNMMKANGYDESDVLF